MVDMTLVAAIMQADKTPEPKTAVELLTARIRTLINVIGLSREECHEMIMSGKNPPTVEEFHLAYSAAAILTDQPAPIAQRFQCTSCDDKGCGFCETGDSLAAYFPQD